jgi:hypothetical protein
MGKKRAPRRAKPLGAAECHRHTVGRAIPWSGCVSAEPASVSPDEGTVLENGPREQEQVLVSKESCRRQLDP